MPNITLTSTVEPVDGPTDKTNTGALHYALFNIMAEKYRANEIDVAYDHCKRLVEWTDVPIMLHARCWIVLSTMKNADGTQVRMADSYIWFALARLDPEVQAMVGREPMDEVGFPQAVRDEALRIQAVIEQEQAVLAATVPDYPGLSDLPDFRELPSRWLSDAALTRAAKERRLRVSRSAASSTR